MWNGSGGTEVWYSVVGALAYFEVGDGDASFAGEHADCAGGKVVDPGAERHLAVHDGDAEVPVHHHFQRVPAGGKAAGAFEFDGEGNIAGHVPLGVAGDGPGPAVEHQAPALRFEAEDVGAVTVRAGAEQHSAFGGAGLDFEHRPGMELGGQVVGGNGGA